MSLFERGNFHLHSGSKSSWKIECDALVQEDIETLALMISERYEFRRVKGVPKTQSTGLDNGGRLAEALQKYAQPDSSEHIVDLLIVDDVLTTGRSMNDVYEPGATGVVIFARDARVCRTPEYGWIEPMFTMWA